MEGKDVEGNGLDVDGVQKLEKDLGYWNGISGEIKDKNEIRKIVLDGEWWIKIIKGKIGILGYLLGRCKYKVILKCLIRVEKSKSERKGYWNVEIWLM